MHVYVGREVVAGMLLATTVNRQSFRIDENVTDPAYSASTLYLFHLILRIAMLRVHLG